MTDNPDEVDTLLFALMTRLDTARIRAARRVIEPIFLNTPLYRCEALAPDLGCTVSIKLETANSGGGRYASSEATHANTSQASPAR